MALFFSRACDPGLGCLTSMFPIPQFKAGWVVSQGANEIEFGIWNQNPTSTPPCLYGSGWAPSSCMTPMLKHFRQKVLKEDQQCHQWQSHDEWKMNKHFKHFFCMRSNSHHKLCCHAVGPEATKLVPNMIFQSDCKHRSSYIKLVRICMVKFQISNGDRLRQDQPDIYFTFLWKFPVQTGLNIACCRKKAVAFLAISLATAFSFVSAIAFL